MSDTRAAPSAERQRTYNGDYMRVGRNAEEIVLRWLRANPHVVGIEDLRELRVMHEADVDCVLVTRDGRCPLVEIKSDAHLGVSKNVLFEVLRINHTCTPEKAGGLGWSLRSPATYFMYYAPATDEIWQCRPDDLRKAFQEYTKTARRSTALQWIETDNIKSTLVVLLPVMACEGVFMIHKHVSGDPERGA